MFLKCPNCSANLPKVFFTPKTFDCPYCSKQITVKINFEIAWLVASIWTLVFFWPPFSFAGWIFQIAIGIALWPILSVLCPSASFLPKDKSGANSTSPNDKKM
jgi:hypothetical protein